MTSSPEANNQPVPDAARRTYALAAALAGLAAFGLLGIDLDRSPVTAWTMPVWVVAVLAVVGSLMVFDVEFRSETYTFTFAELVLVLGLFFATPVGLIVGRLCGELFFLTVKERQPPRKVVMNLSVYFAEVIVLLTMQQVLLAAMEPRRPLAWVVALVAVVAAELVGFAAVATVVRWHGGPLSFRSILQIGLVTAPANTCLALIVSILLDVEPLAVPLLGGVAVFLLVTYRSYSSLRQRYESLSLLYDFTHLVSGAREPDEVLDAMLTQAKDLLRAERAEFWLLTGTDTYQRHAVDDSGHTSERCSVPGSIATVLADDFSSRRDALLIGRDDASTRAQAVLVDLEARDALLAPIVEGDALVGFVAVANRLSDIYTFVPQDARMFGTLASHAGVALQNGRLIRRLHEQATQREHEARHDSLTGLANRVQFGDRLEARFADGEGDIAIALMDLDGFKEVNDTLGHQSGDQVLVEVARRLQSAVKASTLAVRLGGDEFALLFGTPRSQQQLEDSCRRIRHTIGAPMEIDGIRVMMGVSIGIAVAPRDGDNAETLIRRADIAMYAAKSGRNGGVCFYDPERDENTPRRLSLASDLRTAIEHSQLRAVFQPKMSLRTGRVIGVEALCRWDHPVHGQVMPDEFIPLADRIGVSGDLTEFMLTRSVRHLERWQDMGHDWGVAVNVSMRNLLDDDLVAIVRRVLGDSRVRPERVTLEITETHVMSDTDGALRALAALSDLGVRLSVDDFGTGYSSLAYLQRLPVDEVKIDKGFVQVLSTDRGADVIVRSVVGLARNLDLSVVAEGVEDLAAMERLRELDCEEAQGYYFAKPMPADEIERFAETATGDLVST